MKLKLPRAYSMKEFAQILKLACKCYKKQGGKTEYKDASSSWIYNEAFADGFMQGEAYLAAKSKEK